MASDRIQRQIERLLDEVEDAISRYDWEAVRQAANAVLAIDPENSDGRTYLATAERAMGGFAPTPTGTPAVSTPTTRPRHYETIVCWSDSTVHQLDRFRPLTHQAWLPDTLR